MKHRWQKIVKDYLTFSATERRGIIALAILTILIIGFTRYYPKKTPPIDTSAFQKELAQLQITVDSSNNHRSYQNDYDQDYYQQKNFEHSNYYKGELFAFDPNTLNDDGWKKLGVRDRTIHTIRNFLAKGYKFRQPEDIARIYGLRPEEAERLKPFVHIAGSDHNNAVASTYSKTSERNEFKPNVSRTVEINSADSSAFIALPGIGSKLANRIINFRNKLGGFSSVDQMGETYGLPDTTFQMLRNRLQCNAAAVRKININTAEPSDLKSHPYIRWNIANAIVNYRMQHGNYQSIEDIRKISIITEELFNKIAPYLSI